MKKFYAAAVIATSMMFAANTAHADLPKAHANCGSFMECLFGKKHTAPGQGQSGVFPNSGLSGATRHQTVSWSESKYPVGTIIVKTPERALYYVSAKGEAIRYAVGVGREGFQWSGNSKIVAKAEWPGWTPPQVMIEREAAKGHIIPPHMDGGPGNPLGARYVYWWTHVSHPWHQQ